MTNLNDTPSAGQLTVAELTRYRELHRPYIPAGCDQQGRNPQAAEACTEMGVDDDQMATARGIVWATILSLALWGVGALVFLALN